jgi:hypothetical protein
MRRIRSRRTAMRRRLTDARCSSRVCVSVTSSLTPTSASRSTCGFGNTRRSVRIASCASDESTDGGCCCCPAALGRSVDDADVGMMWWATSVAPTPADPLLLKRARSSDGGGGGAVHDPGVVAHARVGFRFRTKIARPSFRRPAAAASASVHVAWSARCSTSFRHRRSRDVV